MNNNQEIRKRSQDLFKENIFPLMLSVAIISLISGLIGSIGGGSRFSLLRMRKMMEYGYYSNNIYNNTFNIWSLLSLIIKNLLFAGFSLEVLSLVRSGQYRIEGIFENIKKYYNKIIVVSLIISGIQYFVGMVPIVGFIFNAILYYAFALSIYLIVDNPDKDYLWYIETSYHTMKNHKLQLFMIDFIYFLILLIGPFISFLGILIAWRSFSGIIFGSILMIIGGILWFILSIIQMPIIEIAHTIFYTELLKNED